MLNSYAVGVGRDLPGAVLRVNVLGFLSAMVSSVILSKLSGVNF